MLMNENTDIKSQLDKVLDEYKQKTKFYETELKQFRTDLESTKNDLDQSLDQNQSLAQLRVKLEMENEQVKELATNQKLRIDELSEELEKLSVQHHNTLNDSQLELKVKLEKLNKELRAQWTETLRYFHFIKDFFE